MKRSIKLILVITASIMLFFSITAFGVGGKCRLEAENTAQGIRLEWSQCEGAYYYEVYRQTGETAWTLSAFAVLQATQHRN